MGKRFEKHTGLTKAEHLHELTEILTQIPEYHSYETYELIVEAAALTSGIITEPREKIRNARSERLNTIMDSHPKLRHLTANFVLHLDAALQEHPGYDFLGQLFMF